MTPHWLPDAGTAWQSAKPWILETGPVPGNVHLALGKTRVTTIGDEG